MRIGRWWVGSAALMLGCGAAGAQTLATSARQMRPGSWDASLYYQGTQGQDLTFTLSGEGRCSGGAPNNPGFGCGASGDIPAAAEGGAVILKVTAQPWESLQYYVSVGAGDLSLRVSSVTVRNVLTGDRPGFQYAAGVRAVILPDTVVSPAVAIDGRIGWERYYFNMLQPAVTAPEGQINQRLDMYRYQVALQTSHRFNFMAPKWSVEPYGGLKWIRTHSYLKDLKGGGRLGGIQDTFTPFLGLILPIYEHEALVAEGSFVDGQQFSIGLQVHFGGAG